MRDVTGLLPDPADGYRGTAASMWFLVALAMLVTARSLAHILLPDGGANSIAGIELGDGAAGTNLVHLFAQWGLEQLLLAVVAWVALIRYRFLIPLVLALQLADWTLRGTIGVWKPLVVDSTPPGGIGNLVLAPLCAVALWFALPPRSRAAAHEAPSRRA